MGGLSGLPSQAPVFVSTRVCTPVPEETPSPLPVVVDPMLTGVATPQGAGHRANAVAIPLTVEELRGMIMDAVQKAMGGIRDQASRTGGESEGEVLEQSGVCAAGKEDR